MRFLISLWPFFSLGLCLFIANLLRWLEQFETSRVKAARITLFSLIFLSIGLSLFISRTYLTFDRERPEFVKYQVTETGPTVIPESEQYDFFNILGLGFAGFELNTVSGWLNLPENFINQKYYDGRLTLWQMATRINRTSEVDQGSTKVVNLDENVSYIDLTAEMRSGQLVFYSDQAAEIQFPIVSDIDYERIYIKCDFSDIDSVVCQVSDSPILQSLDVEGDIFVRILSEIYFQDISCSETCDIVLKLQDNTGAEFKLVNETIRL